MSFVTIFWDVIFERYYNILGWKFIMIFRKNLFGTNKKFVYLIFIPKYLPKDMNKS